MLQVSITNVAHLGGTGKIYPEKRPVTAKNVTRLRMGGDFIEPRTFPNPNLSVSHTLAKDPETNPWGLVKYPPLKVLVRPYRTGHHEEEGYYDVADLPCIRHQKVVPSGDFGD